MRSFEQLGLQDLTRFELGQFFKHRFCAAYFERFWCLCETLKRRAERKRQKDVPIHGSDGDTNHRADVKLEHAPFVPRFANRSEVNPPG
jgi:hypothetical protein